MAWFARKKDPLNQRKSQLNSEIRDLESKIREMQSALEGYSKSPPSRPPREASPQTKPSQSATEPTIPQAPKQPVGEPVFEPVNQKRLDNLSENPFQEASEKQRQIHKEGSVTFFQKVARFFKGPTNSNPQLVRYLAAGNIHGLKPLRYERRVARNRLILWSVIFVIVLVGLIYMFFY